MLEVKNLSVSYGPINAVKGISFKVNKGEIVTIIGSNGAGKTSTLRSISNITPKAGGKIKFFNEDITNLPSHKIVEKGICHVPEGRKIFGNLTVEENLYMGAYVKTNQAEKEFEENKRQVYDLFPRLEERKKNDGKNLSGGEQQMLAIGRGLMLNPKIMMLDEPSLGLAPMLVEKIFELIERINKELDTTFLLVEQNAKKALQTADRGYVIELGKISKEGNSEELLDDSKLVEAYLGV
ncbi:MAG: ABC transporter ATP-binding protein [Halanaerobiales bacterium]|nr:ABC transporter ATP-binding protein [Halanaerobiales bacterium]